MFGDGALTLREFAMNEPLPLAKIHDAVLEFLRHRNDAVLFGAQAVNAYVEEPRMTQDVDILSTRAPALAEEIRSHLASEFKIAVRIREVASGRGFRVFQLREPKNRHLVDIRQIHQLPANQLIADVRVLVPEALIAQKIISITARSGQPKGDTDRRDLKLLLLNYPALKVEKGAVYTCLLQSDASPAAMAQWVEAVASDIQTDDGEY